MTWAKILPDASRNDEQADVSRSFNTILSYQSVKSPCPYDAQRAAQHSGEERSEEAARALRAWGSEQLRIPDAMLTYARSLRQKPIVYPTCFLSYASADQRFAEHLHSDLQSHDVFYWSAPYDDGYEEK